MGRRFADALTLLVGLTLIVVALPMLVVEIVVRRWSAS